MKSELGLQNGIKNLLNVEYNVEGRRIEKDRY
jgi:hypothetical protein